MMDGYDPLAHERTLGGAVDSYVKQLVRVRPQLARAYADQLEAFLAVWQASLQPNDVTAVTTRGLLAFLAQSDDPVQARAALADFFRWAVAQELIAEPLLVTAS